MLASASPSAQFAVVITVNEQSRAVASYRSCANALGNAARAATSNATAVAPGLVRGMGPPVGIHFQAFYENSHPRAASGRRRGPGKPVALRSVAAGAARPAVPEGGLLLAQGGVAAPLQGACRQRRHRRLRLLDHRARAAGARLRRPHPGARGRRSRRRAHRHPRRPAPRAPTATSRSTPPSTPRSSSARTCATGSGSGPTSIRCPPRRSRSAAQPGRCATGPGASRGSSCVPRGACGDPASWER